MLNNSYRKLLTCLCISLGMLPNSAMGMEADNPLTEDTIGIVILNRHLGDDTLSIVSTCSKSLALKTEGAFKAKSSIKMPLPLTFSAQQEEGYRSLWQPAKHSYFLRAQFEECLKDLRTNSSIYGDWTEPFDYENELIKKWRKLNSFPRYCNLHGFMGGTLVEILLGGSYNKEIDAKTRNFANTLAVGIANNDPMSLEIAWAFACYHLDKAFLHSQGGPLNYNWSEALTELLTLSNLKSPRYENMLLSLSKHLYFQGLQEIKEHYGLEIDIKSLQVMRRTYEDQLKKVDGRAFPTEDEKRETKKRYKNDVLIYTTLLKRKEKIFEEKRAKSRRMNANYDYKKGEELLENAVKLWTEAAAYGHAEAQQMLAKLMAAGLIDDKK